MTLCFQSDVEKLIFSDQQSGNLKVFTRSVQFIRNTKLTLSQSDPAVLQSSFMKL